MAKCNSKQTNETRKKQNNTSDVVDIGRYKEMRSLAAVKYIAELPKKSLCDPLVRA